jgi:hypothetical protein
VLLFGCGQVHFVETRPPRLFHAQAEWRTGAAPEPVVWMPVLDLFIERPQDCAAAKAWTVDAVRAAVSANEMFKIELPAQDLSPQCTQPAGRALDVSAAQAALQKAREANPQLQLRPILVYANNVDLAVAESLRISLLGFKAAEAAQARPLPLVWSLSRESVASQLGADNGVKWSYAGDSALAERIGALAAAELPLQTDTDFRAGPLPLLTGEELARAQLFKVCGVPRGVTLAGLADDGSAVAVDLAHPPLFSVDVPQRVGLPRSQFQPQVVKVPVEGCEGNCERYFDYHPGDEPRPWNATLGCLEEGT